MAKSFRFDKNDDGFNHRDRKRVSKGERRRIAQERKAFAARADFESNNPGAVVVKGSIVKGVLS